MCKIALFLLTFSTVAYPLFSRGNTSPSPDTGFVEITQPTQFQAVYAISDVHAMLKPLLSLLQNTGITDQNNHWAAKKSLFLVLGDSIDKGPSSIEVIEFWMALQKEAELAGGKVIHLLGNHEAELLADPNNDPKATALEIELESRGSTLEKFASASDPHGAFLRSLPAGAKVGKWIFCHAGFVKEKDLSTWISKSKQLITKGAYGDSFFIGNDSFLEAKDWWKKHADTRDQMNSFLDANALAGVVFGHQPKALHVEGASAISDSGKLVKIDNGMAPEAGAHSGSLLVLHFSNTGEIIRFGTLTAQSPATEQALQSEQKSD